MSNSTTNPLFSYTMCFCRDGRDTIVTGRGGSQHEAMSDAIRQATGFKVLWGTVPNGVNIPSPAAPAQAGELPQGRTFEDMHQEAGSPPAGVVEPPPATVPLTTPAPGPDGFEHTGDHDGPRNELGNEGERNVVKENSFTGHLHDVEADSQAQQERNQAEADQAQEQADIEQKDEEEAHPHRKGKRKH